MTGRQHISGGASAHSSPKRSRESLASDSRFDEASPLVGSSGCKRKPPRGIDPLVGPDCEACGRFQPPEREPFVGPKIVAEFLDLDKETVNRYARLGYIPAHPLHVAGKRVHWRFLLSEVHAAILSRTNTYCEPHLRRSHVG